ncbi:MAG: O-methyltransferase, partial [Flavisolibacter sp.]
MHSPFVYDFIRNVINNNNKYEPPDDIENVRHSLLLDERIINIHEMGAGSRKDNSEKRSVRSIAQTALKTKKYSLLLFRLVRHYNPEFILELGTSLGITTSYLSFANPVNHIITVEGNEQIATIAKETFNKLNCRNIRLINDNFDNALPILLQQIKYVDFAYIDGNHRYEPTIAYFEQLLQKINYNSILIFDDIHWSVEMEKAWNEIKDHPAVQYTIDIFFLG